MEMLVNSSIDTTIKIIDGSGSASSDLVITTSSKSNDGAFTTLTGNTAVEEFQGVGAIPIAITYSNVEQSLEVKAGILSKLYSIVAVRTGGDCNEDTCKNGEDYNNQLGALTLDDATSSMALVVNGTFHESHSKEFSNLFESGVEIIGRPDVSKAINSSLYYLLSSIRNDTHYSLSPGGLASNSYNGHTFWDTETWMLPPLILLKPDVAKSALLYRFNRMEGARDKAISYDEGYEGAMFPWESASTGREVTPSWAATGAREQHISADIGLAIVQYFYCTGDADFMKEAGLEMLEEISSFWISRTEIDEDHAAHIIDVIPPDEYVDHVNDSVYTNAAVAKLLNLAADLVEAFGGDAPDAWREIASALVLPFDSERRIYKEHDGYVNETIKQADVVLLDYPLGLEMNDDVKANNLKFYSNVTDPAGPAMTWGIHSLGYLGLKQWDDAASNFNRSFDNTKNSPYLVWQETPTGGATNFITGAGGFLQAVLNGYGGVRVSSEGMSIYPTLFEGTSSFVLRALQYRGCKIDVSINEEEIKLVRRGGCKDVSLSIGIVSSAKIPFVEGVEEAYQVPLNGAIIISTI